VDPYPNGFVVRTVLICLIRIQIQFTLINDADPNPGERNGAYEVKKIMRVLFSFEAKTVFLWSLRLFIENKKKVA